MRCDSSAARGNSARQGMETTFECRHGCEKASLKFVTWAEVNAFRTTNRKQNQRTHKVTSAVCTCCILLELFGQEAFASAPSEQREQVRRDEYHEGDCTRIFAGSNVIHTAAIPVSHASIRASVWPSRHFSSVPFNITILFCRAPTIC